MKAVCVILLCLILSGCQQQILTWTPTAEEWAAMTPEQRNAWSLNERRARQDNWNSIQKGFDDVARRGREERESQTPIVVPTTQKQNSTYWQEQRARQEYVLRQRQEYAPQSDTTAGWWKKIK